MGDQSNTLDNLSIRCRVRRSPYAINPKFDEDQEMTCTLRNWGCSSEAEPAVFPIWNEVPGSKIMSSKDKKGSNVSKDDDPELILCPIHSSKVNNDSRTNSFSLLPLSTTTSQNMRAAEIAAGVSQRFHSFGSIPHMARDDSDVSGSSSEKRRRALDESCLSSPPKSISVYHVDSDLSVGSHEKGKKGLDVSMHSLPPRIGNYRKVNKPRHLSSFRRVTSNSSLPDMSFLKTCAIPLSDIVVVDLTGKHTYRNPEFKSDTLEEPDADRFSSRLTITTASNGYFEFSFHSKNTRDVLVALLQSSLPAERFYQVENYLKAEVRSIKSSDTYSTRGINTVDMDKFTAKEINEWVKTETMSQKLKRRAYTFSSKLGEITLTLSECVCGDQSVVNNPNSRQTSIAQKPLNESVQLQTPDAPYVQMIMSYETDRALRSKPSHGKMKINTNRSPRFTSCGAREGTSNLSGLSEEKETLSIGSKNNEVSKLTQPNLSKTGYDIKSEDV